MRFRTLLIVLAVLTVLRAANGSESAATGGSCCAIAEQALRTFGKIKVGMTRAELEKYVAMDGGAQFRTPGRYVYPKCDYLKIEVEFNFDAEVGRAFSPKDKVLRVGRPYIEYPTKD